MDSTAKEILIMLIERLREIEKTRLMDRADLLGLRAAFCLAAPENFKKWQEERDTAAKTLQEKDPAHGLDEIYAGLIELLRSPDPTEKENEEKLRRLFESYKGPIQ